MNTGGVKVDARIRRLTPTECSRLMSLPDDWLKYGIDEKGNQFEISDSQKYKMAGNGVVVNVVEEIIKNLIY
jgi:DNA (cytosine-5)-methyltransferase 1